MKTQLVRIVQDKEGWIDWAVRQVKENPGKSAAAAAVGAPFLAFELPVALASGAAIAGGGLVWDWWTGSDRIEQIPLSKAIALQDRDGHALKVDQIYAHHPLRRTFPSTVIAADQFHSQMISDQMADIARFLKAHVLLKELRITVSSANGAKLDGTATSGAKDLGIRAHMNSSLHHELFQVEENPVIVPYEFEPYWMTEFPEIRAAVAHSSKGSMTRTIGIDTSFGLTASVAQQAGINADWLSKQLFKVEATYG